MPVPKQLKEVLVETGFITEAELAQALEKQKETGEQLGSILVRLGFLKKEELLACLKEKFGILSAELKEVQNIEPAILELIPRDMAERYVAIPLELKGRKLTVAMADPLDVADINDIQFRVGHTIVPVFAFESEIKDAINRFYSQGEGSSVGVGKTASWLGEERKTGPVLETDRIREADYSEETSSPDEGGELVVLTDVDSPLNKLIQGIFSTALQNHVDEIHIESQGDGVRIRYRIDNLLYEALKSPKSIKSTLLTRFRRLLRVETTSKSESQKKFLRLKLGDRYPVMSLSIFSYSLSNGEKILLRVRDKSSLLNLNQLGLDMTTVKYLQETLRKPVGCMLVTGPVRSGKISTLYALLNQAVSSQFNIMALESSPAYSLKGVNQIRVFPEEGFTYLTGLRLIKDHRPDLVMIDKLADTQVVGEVFDLAAKTRLMSSLGVLDTTQAIMKLFTCLPVVKLANNLNIVIAQRLVRKICEDCKKPTVLSESQMERWGFTPQDPCYVAKGCSHCGYTGYRGLTGIFEILPCSDAIRRLILKGCSAEELKALAIQEGMSTLRKSGLEKVKQGITTVNEVIRATLRSS